MSYKNLNRDLFPTKYHFNATKEVLEFLEVQNEVEAVLLYGSCARGAAAESSCVDLALLIPKKLDSNAIVNLNHKIEDFQDNSSTYQELLEQGMFTELHIDSFTGEFSPKPRGFTDWPDKFELEVGNFINYSIPLIEKNDRFKQLKATWLPYYSEELAEKRLIETVRFMVNNLRHIPLYANRGLVFQGFDRLYHAFQEFLQALFISFRKYPIAYNKWIEEQLVEILYFPQLTPILKSILEISEFSPNIIIEKAELLEKVARNNKLL